MDYFCFWLKHLSIRPYFDESCQTLSVNKLNTSHVSNKKMFLLKISCIRYVIMKICLRKIHITWMHVCLVVAEGGIKWHPWPSVCPSFFPSVPFSFPHYNLSLPHSIFMKFIHNVKNSQTTFEFGQRITHLFWVMCLLTWRIAFFSISALLLQCFLVQILLNLYTIRIYSSKSNSESITDLEWLPFLNLGKSKAWAGLMCMFLCVLR